MRTVTEHDQDSQINPDEIDPDGIEAAALAAPGGKWDHYTDGMWLDWHDNENDDEYEPGDPCESGRWIGIREQAWHDGTGSGSDSDDPPPELWKFLAGSRENVLDLVAEVRRLRKALGEAGVQAE